MIRLAAARQRARLVQPTVLWLGLMLLGLSFGCSKPVANVAGTLSSNGQPVTGADLYLAPTDAPDSKYYGLTLPGGEIQIDPKDGLSPGQYEIVVLSYKMRDGKPLPEGEEGDAAKENGTAVKQAHSFKWFLEPGDNDLKLDLSQGEATRKGLDDE